MRELLQKLNFNQGESLEICEVGDGNLNLVFLVNGKNIKLCVKQALPYVRCVGPSWPFPLSRTYYEYNALKFQNKVTPEFVPKLHYFNKDLSLMIME